MSVGVETVDNDATRLLIMSEGGSCTGMSLGGCRGWDAEEAPVGTDIAAGAWV